MRKKAWAVGLGLMLLFSLAAAPVPDFTGPELAVRLGCWSCHALKGRGGTAGVPLDGVGGRLSAADLAAVLTRPRSRLPGAKMPSYAYLRPGEMQALTEYLAGMK